MFAFPPTGRPGAGNPDGWDMIPGARGCAAPGVDRLFGLSARDTACQREAVRRLPVPFPLLSDPEGALAAALRLPTFAAGGRRLLRGATLVVEAGRTARASRPVVPPDRSAGDVMAWLADRRA